MFRSPTESEVPHGHARKDGDWLCFRTGCYSTHRGGHGCPHDVSLELDSTRGNRGRHNQLLSSLGVVGFGGNHCEVHSNTDRIQGLIGEDDGQTFCADFTEVSDASLEGTNSVSSLVILYMHWIFQMIGY